MPRDLSRRILEMIGELLVSTSSRRWPQTRHIKTAYQNLPLVQRFRASGEILLGVLRREKGEFAGCGVRLAHGAVRRPLGPAAQVPTRLCITHKLARYGDWDRISQPARDQVGFDLDRPSLLAPQHDNLVARQRRMIGKAQDGADDRRQVVEGLYHETGVSSGMPDAF